MKTNISAYVEHVIEHEQILEQLQQAKHVKDPKPEDPKKATKTKATPLNLCPEHKMYGAKRRPQTDCVHCWEAYEKLNGKDATIRARRDFTRKTKLGKVS